MVFKLSEGTCVGVRSLVLRVCVCSKIEEYIMMAPVLAHLEPSAPGTADDQSHKKKEECTPTAPEHLHKYMSLTTPTQKVVL